MLAYVLALTALPLAVFGQSPPALCQRLECPQYNATAITQSGTGYNEVRSYGATRWVSTQFRARMMRGFAFFRLFGYIQGANDQGVKMNMTAPVLMGRAAGSPVKTMQFYIPEAVAQAPAPTNNQNNRLDWPARDFYVRTFTTEGRYPSESEWSTELGALKAAIGDASLYDASLHFTAGYNSPMDRGQRTSEIWLPKL